MTRAGQAASGSRIVVGPVPMARPMAHGPGPSDDASLETVVPVGEDEEQVLAGLQVALPGQDDRSDPGLPEAVELAGAPADPVVTGEEDQITAVGTDLVEYRHVGRAGRKSRNVGVARVEGVADLVKGAADGQKVLVDEDVPDLTHGSRNERRHRRLSG